MMMISRHAKHAIRGSAATGFRSRTMVVRASSDLPFDASSGRAAVMDWKHVIPNPIGPHLFLDISHPRASAPLQLSVISSGSG